MRFVTLYKIFSFLCLFLLSNNLSRAQRCNDISEQNLPVHFTEEMIYIVCRGTKSKQGIISKNFNLLDKNITHIGIGIFIKNKFKVYNVTNDIGYKTNSFVIETLESFLNRQDLRYCAIWSLKRPKGLRQRIIENCESYRDKFIYFDNVFNLNNGDSLYCSEFVVKILNASGIKPSIKPTLKILNDYFLEQISGQKQISYYSVDFFLNFRSIKKIYEYCTDNKK